MANFGRINDNNVVPTINAFQIWAVEDLRTQEEDRQFAMLGEVNHLASRIDAILYRLEVLLGLRESLRKRAEATGSAARIGPTELTDARHEVNAAFYEFVRLQDRITAFPSRLLGYHDEQYSMSKMVKNMKADKNLNPFFRKTNTTFVQYWTGGGEALRKYRVLATHYHPVFDQSWFDPATGQIVILVPDNPEEKSWKDLKFEMNLNGADLAFSYSRQLFDFCETILQELAKDVIPAGSSAWKGGHVLVADLFWPDGLKIEIKR